MSVHIEAQTEREVEQIRVREKQQNNMEKLDKMIPVVESLENISLENVEANTNQIKNVVLNNLEHQPDIQDVLDKIEGIEKKVDGIKKSISDIKKKNTQINKEIKNIKNTMEG